MHPQRTGMHKYPAIDEEQCSMSKFQIHLKFNGKAINRTIRIQREKNDTAVNLTNTERLVRRSKHVLLKLC